MRLLHYEHNNTAKINNKTKRLIQHLYDSVVTAWPAVYCNVLDKTPTHWILNSKLNIFLLK